jgi:DNA-binding transcriptional LysR family regulator
MDPRRLLTFRAVARERSFTRAAATLALTQPSVSQQVAALEAELGTKLLERRPGGPEPTEAGAVLLEHADAIAGRLDLATAQLAELAATARATLRLGAFSSALADLVPAAVQRLQERHPELAVTVDEVSSAEAEARVRAGDLHVALAFQDAAAPRREPDGLDRVDLHRERFLVALPPDHRLAGRATIAIADLAEEGWTLPSLDGLLVRACRAAGFAPRVVSVTREQVAIRAMIRRGLAVTLAPELLAGAFEGLALRPIAGGGPERAVFALLPPGRRHPLAREALDDLTGQVADLRGAA